MLISVDAANDIAEFLTSRRAKVTPEQVGLPTYGPRRVEGLRREARGLWHPGCLPRDRHHDLAA